MVMGEGRQPTIDNLEQLGQQAQLSKETIFEIIERTREAISRWPILAREYGVLRKNVRLIGARIGVD
jgi:serine/threonine-protein kinase HipA